MPGGLPVIWKLEGRRCVIVGGGEVAARRARSLVDAGAQVTVIAPQIEEGVRKLAIACNERAYEPGDLGDAALVVVATDDAAVNEAIAADARALGILVNRADDPGAGDIAIPAHAQHGAVTVAVHTDGISASAAATIRRQLSAALDPDWPRLLTVAGPFRAVVQQHYPDATHRRERLRQLTDDTAMTILKREGEAALHKHLRRVSQAP